MNKILLIIILFLASCTYNKDSKSNVDFNFNDNLTLNEFKLKIDMYVDQSMYPQIDN